MQLFTLKKNVKSKFYIGIRGKKYFCVDCPVCGYEKRISIKKDQGAEDGEEFC